MMTVLLPVLAALICICIGIYHHYLPPVPKRFEKTYPYALLLGCPNRKDGSLSRSQIKRCTLAMEAYEKGMFETLVITGGAVKNQYVESEEMKHYIEQRMQMNIICETQARNTFENFAYAKKIIGSNPVLILCSSLHARRSSAIAAQFFHNFSVMTYPDHKFKHILREIASQWIYIRIEIMKSLHLYPEKSKEK